jgi:dienelactone hydrolase
MAVGYQLVEDLLANVDRYDLAKRAAQMRAAHLILHAEQDLAVDPAEAELLRAGRTEAQRCRLQELANTGHTFNAVHPFAGPTPALDQAIQYSLEWFEKYA